MQPTWRGVFPAVTTPFTADDEVDLAAFERQLRVQLEAGVDGVVVLGSLGENGTLGDDEKRRVIETAAAVCRGRVPLISCVAERATRNACRFAEAAARAGADGFMLLPPLLYPSDRRETLTYLRTVARAGGRPVMLYNNPIAYRTDLPPEALAELADEPRFVALKESSGDVRRVAELRRLVGERYQIFTGVDDLALESLLMGAVGWVAGLVCAFPRETVALYRLAQARRLDEAQALYHWFLPLLRLDVSPKFVQNIKLVEQLVGLGSEAVRAPRLPLTGAERAEVEGIVAAALASRPSLPMV